MPKKTPGNDAELLSETEKLYHLAEMIAARIEGRSSLSLSAEQIKEVQRNLMLAARDATTTACALFTYIRIAESEEKLKASQPAAY